MNFLQPYINLIGAIMILLIVHEDLNETAGRMEQIVSHGIDLKTNRTLALPQEHPRLLGAVFDTNLGEYVIRDKPAPDLATRALAAQPDGIPIERASGGRACAARLRRHEPLTHISSVRSGTSNSPRSTPTPSAPIDGCHQVQMASLHPVERALQISNHS